MHSSIKPNFFPKQMNICAGYTNHIENYSRDAVARGCLLCSWLCPSNTAEKNNSKFTLFAFGWNTNTGMFEANDAPT